LVGTLSRLDPDQPLVSLLREQPMILPTTASAVRVAFDSLVNRQDIQPRVIAEVDDMAMMRLLAVEDIGLALVPRIVVQDELASGRLVEAIERPPITETFFAVTMERRFPNLLLKRLLTSDGLRRID